MNLSLRTKTIIGIGAIEAVLLAVLITTVMFHMRSSNEQQLQERVHTTTSLFSTTSKDAVLSYDLASLEDFTKEVMKNPGMVYARVIGPNHTVFSESGDPGHLKRKFDADKSIENVSDGVYDSFAEIVDGGVVFGRVEIGIDTDTLDAQLTTTRQLSATIALVEISLVALFSYLLGGYLTGQLKFLRKAARLISEGTLDVNIPVKGGDEIAEVASAFNRMTKNLQVAQSKRDEYEEELKSLNHSLEEQVEQRTEKLVSKNSELSAAYEKLQAAQSQLLQSEKMASVGQLAAGVAHEINNPVGFISSNLESLKVYIETYQNLIESYQTALDCNEELGQLEIEKKIRAFRESEDIEFVNQDISTLVVESIEGTRRVSDIVQNLKGFAHADSSEQKSVDINQCIHSTLKMVNNELKYKCNVITDLGSIPLVTCVAGQINQVLLNLVINASHAIEQNGEIRISTEHCDYYVKIQISDTGKGIDPENIVKLFDPFFTTKPVGEGTGLGLSIVYGIVSEEHNGEITVQSELGKGTCFTIYLPILGREAENPAMSVAAAS